jgi:predicted Zn-dependent peptidase
MPGVRSATLGFFFRSGARHEPRELHGISHFIEHAVFKGTENRSTLEIAIEQDRLGGNLDAFTTHEEMGFAIKVIDDEIEKAFGLIADILTHPRFDDKDLKAEQRVIIEEMKMIDDSPEEYLGEIFNAAYFPGHPLGMPIAGTPKTVRSFSSDITRRYHEATNTCGNLVIVAAGNVEHKQILDLARSTGFSRLSVSGGRLEAELRTTTPIPAAPIILKQRSDLEQAHFVIATPFTAGMDERRYAADMLANIIGGGTSSRLWQTVREDRGLAYSVGASGVMYNDCGLFSIFAASSPEHVEEVVKLSIDEMRSIVKDGVREDELELSKQQARASILLSLEDSAARAAALAQSEITYGRQIPVEETLARVEAVTTDEIRVLAIQYFETEAVAFAALGNLEGIAVDRSDLAM